MGRQLKPILMGAIFTIVAMGFAYALPHAVQLQPVRGDEMGEVVIVEPECPVDETTDDDPSSEDPGEDEAVEDEAVEGEAEQDEAVAGEGDDDEAVEGEGDEGEVVEADAAEECDEPEEDPAEEKKVEGQGDHDGEAANHGRVVRVAAHCEVKGRAHGELVRSIAKDKEATVDDAEAACNEAMAAAEASGGRQRAAKPDKAEKSGKPDQAGKDKHTNGGSNGVSSSDADGATHGKGAGAGASTGTSKGKGK